MKHEGWAEVAARLGFSLPDRADEQLDAYEDLLRSYAAPRGIVGPAERRRLRERHIVDGLRGVPLLRPSARVADLGSGAGLPGIPIAIARPDLSMSLVEPRRSRVAFLEQAVETLELPGTRVVPKRVGDLDERFDACVVRAFASLEGTWEAAERILRPSGSVLYWGGAGLTEAALDVPGATVTLVPTPFTSELAEAGPIVIMTRQ